MAAMSNKQNRTSHGVGKVPSRFNDHIVGNKSQKRNSDCKMDKIESIRVPDGELDASIGEKGQGSELGEKSCAKEVVDDVGSECLGIGELSGERNAKQDCNEQSMPVGETNGMGAESQEVPTDARQTTTQVQWPLNNTDQIHSNKNKLGNKSYASVTNNGKDIDKKLLENPTELDENGNEMIAEGSKKWENILCGYFVGDNTSINELRYNLRRMWGRYDFKDIVDVCNGIYYMKFFREEGLVFVANNGPWMVKNKPLIVQKWGISLNLDKKDLVKIPVWIKICGVPIEAWTVKGISALASRVGKPLVMDTETARVCQLGVGRLGFARVLVEVNASKEIPKSIEMVYRNGLKEIVCRKMVMVNCDWTPPRCSICCIFGHLTVNCDKNHKEQEIGITKEVIEEKGEANNDGFVEVKIGKKEDGEEISIRITISITEIM